MSKRFARLCWRHWLSLQRLCFASLIDLSGRTFKEGWPPVQKRIYACPRCMDLNRPKERA